MRNSPNDCPNIWLIAAISLLALSAVLTPSARPQTKDPNLYSLDREKKIGEALAKEVERSSKLVDDPGITEYLNRIGQTIAKNSGAQFPVTIRVIDSGSIDALTLPGGFQYVNTGLILATESEAELAAVLAHGIAHTAMRSGTKQATKGELMQLASIPAMVFTPYSMYSMFMGPNLAMHEGQNLAIPLTYLKFRRDAELAADLLDVQYLYKAGYSPDSFPQLLERMWPQVSQPANIPKPFSTFPPLPDRLKAIRTQIDRLQPKRDAAVVSSSEFQAIQERLRALQLQKLAAPQAAKPTLGKPTARP